ncbi:MAG: LVIVD repeat-containing protein [Actinomycetota bacterium]
MRNRPCARRRLATGAALAVIAALLLSPEAPADTMATTLVADHQCAAKDRPEPGIQGDVPKAEQDANRAYGGYNCGLALVGHTALGAGGRPPTGNANMAWSGSCAYVSGRGAVFGPPSPGPTEGVAVVDVSNPRQPRHVETLRTPGAKATLETLHAVTTKDRAVLVVGQYGNGRGAEGPKPMDIYDVSSCAKPKLLETFYFPANIHNLTVSGNGRYVFATQPLQVVDLDPLFDTNPKTKARYLGNLEESIPGLYASPAPVADVDDAVPYDAVSGEARGQTNSRYLSHEAWPNDAGTRLYLGGQLPTFETITIVDISEWLERTPDGAPAGDPRIVSQRSGRGHSVRTAKIGERRYLLHSEESVIVPGYGCAPEELNPFAGPAEPWLTDITDERNPVRVAQFGLAINQVENCGAQAESGTVASVHYHDVDSRQDTTFVMASMWNAGLRIFDVRDPAKPTEVAYFNPADVDPGDDTNLDHAWGHIRYVAKNGHIWFATSAGGFWVVELEPQLRSHLGLDDGAGAPPVSFPQGRPGTLGAKLAVPTALTIDATPYYCTLGSAASIAT